MVYSAKIFAASDESTTVEQALTETITKKSMTIETPAKVQPKSSVRLPALQARDLYENIEIAVEGRPIPADFVALSPLDCS